MRTACAVPGGKPRKVTHLGGENGVTGSCHLLQANGLNILVDCGAAQGNDAVPAMADWPVKAADIRFVFVTHAHVDHSGRIPELVKNGFHGEIITTDPTKALLVPMLRDAMSVWHRGSWLRDCGGLVMTSSSRKDAKHATKERPMVADSGYDGIKETRD
jgi:Cft2 family RNA processing exonuclease